MLTRFLANAAALAVATLLVPGISAGGTTNADKVFAILLVAVIFGVVNALVKPFFTFVTAPLVLVTLGIFLLVVNAALLMLTSWLAGYLQIGWHVDDFWSAVLGALIVSTVSFIVNAFLDNNREETHQ
ncbi:phage holin family protein [Propionicicella superfundia]|uniref:phage holin family protein n=1 Tax=Propionicicella superfundia TaxID=348582 RepID=UPI000416D065|nr:phage holin family protein [Propionicicella superfundia]